MAAMSCLLFLVFGVAGVADTAAVAEKAEKISIQRDSERVAVFTVETVSDKKAMQQGLSGRSSMPDDHGMLFILDSTAEHFFWMKGMEFPIDILFFDRDKRLIEVLPELTLCEECTEYKTPVRTSYALEINAGMAGALGIKTGDNLVFTDK
jgi:uncharacterized membrane protein (UPF0127 family)